MVQVLERSRNWDAELGESDYSRVASDSVVGNIPGGMETAHEVLSDSFSEIVLCFNATVDMLQAPVIDPDSGTTVVDEVDRVEVHTNSGKMYLLTRGVDKQGHPTRTALFHDGTRNLAVVSIDGGDKGQFLEQYHFRYVNDLRIEGPSEPVPEEQCQSVFGNIIDKVVSDQASIVIDL